MWDLVKFKYMGNDSGGLELAEISKLPKDFFAQSADVQKARGIVKKAKYFYFEGYGAEEGLVKQMKENDCALVVAISDFFAVLPKEAAKRMAMAANLVKIAKHYGVKVRVCTLAKDEMEMRDIYEIYWIGRELGLSEEQMGWMREENLECKS